MDGADRSQAARAPDIAKILGDPARLFMFG
jgi:hypothetical protein